MGVATNENIIEGNKWTLLLCETVRQPKYVVRREPDHTNTYGSTNYYDTPKYVVDVFG